MKEDSSGKELGLVPGIYCRCCYYYQVLLFRIFARIFFLICDWVFPWSCMQLTTSVTLHIQVQGLM